MRMHTRMLLGSLLAALALASAVSSASANRLSLSSTTFRQVWTPLSISNSEFAVTMTCNVTVEGSFHSAQITKVREALLGYITRARFGHPCTGSGN